MEEKLFSIPSNTILVSSFDAVNESSIVLIAKTTMTVSYYMNSYEDTGHTYNGTKQVATENTIVWGDYRNCGIFYITA